MIELFVPPQAALAALRDVLAPLHEKMEPGQLYTIEGVLKPDGSLTVRATVVPSSVLSLAAE